MANNDIKITVSADSKPFIAAINQVIQTIGKLNQMKVKEKDLELSGVGQFVRQCAEVGESLAKIADRKVNITVDTEKAEGNIRAFIGMLEGLADKTVNISANAEKAVAEVEKVKESFKEVKQQKVDVQVTGSMSGVLTGLMEKVGALANAKIPLFSGGQKDELSPKGDFSKVTKSAREFKMATAEIIAVIDKVGKKIEEINRKKIKIKTDLKLPKWDVKDFDESWLIRAIGSAAKFLQQLKLINTELQTAVKRAAKVQIPLASTPQNTPNRQPRAPDKGSSSSGGFFDGFLGGAAKASAVVAGLTYSLGKVKDVAAAIVMPGFNFTKEMETAQLGIAGILTSMTNLDGKAMDFSSAMSISGDIMKKLQRDAILTSATTEEMVTTFRALLAPGIGAGMNVDEIEEFTKVGVNAIKAMGLNDTQFVQELRDLVQGGIQASSSTLATSLGLTDADIKEAKASSEGLFKFLMDRMAGFAPMAEEFPKTLSGKLSILQEFATNASAKITQTFTPEIKAALDLVTGMIATINKETGKLEINPKILGFIDTLKSGVDDIIDLFGEMNTETGKFELDPEIISFFDELSDGVGIACDSVMDLFDAVESLFFGFSDASVSSDVWRDALSDLWDILKDIVAMAGDCLEVVGNMADKVLAAINPFRKFAASGIGWAIGKLKEFIHYAKIGWEALAKLSGGQLTAQAESEEERKETKRRRWRELSDRQERYKKAQGTITSKFPNKAVEAELKKAEKERQKEAQKALKEMLKYWKNQLDLIQREFKKKQETLKLKLDQDAISSDQAYMQELQDTIGNKNQELANIEGRINDIQSLALKDEDKERELENLYKERDFAKADIDDLTKALNELVSALGKYNTMTPQQAIRKYGLDSAGFDTGGADFLTAQSSDVDQLIYKYAQANGVDPYLIKAMISRESGGNIDALSGAGAQGIMQLMPDTAQAMGVIDPYDLEQNIMGGVKYMAQQLQEFGGDVRLALAAYNAGPGAVKQYGGIPPYTETQKYVPEILKKMDEMKAAQIQTRVPQAGVGEGSTWYRVETENPKYDALDDNAKIALEAVAKYYKDLTGEQLGLTSGKRSADLGYDADSIGGHYTGMKFDATAEALNDPEIRRKVVDFAKSVGIQVLDEYADPTVKATERHLDFNAANFDPKTAKIPGINADVNGLMNTRKAYDAVKARIAVRGEAKDILKKYNEMMLGDISEYQVAEIEAQYEAVRKKLANYENDDLARSALDKIDKLIAGEKLQINFSQTQKNLEYANAELFDAQEELLNEYIKGSKSSTQVTAEYLDKAHTMLDGKLDELQKELVDAMKIGNKDLAINLRSKIKDVVDTISNGIQAILQRIDDQMNDEIALANANSDLTNMQRDDMIDAIRRRGAASKVDALQQQIARLENLSPVLQSVFKEDERDADTEIATLQRQLELNEAYAKTPSLLEDIHQASKQAFEDGLLDFLTRGILECENLGDAFRNLAISILESIQKVYAEALTKDIMNSLFPVDQQKDGDTTSTAAQGAALSGTFGNITTETNGFLVSFNQQMGQFNIAAQQAFQGILQTIQSAASSIPSMMPSFNFGSIFGGSSSSGGGFSYNSQYGNWWDTPGFAEGGAIDGPGTSTSDSILARLSRGEFVVNAEAVKRVGTNFLNSVNSGDIYNMHIPIPKFAQGGAVGDVAARGMSLFSADVANHFSPTVHNDIRIDGNKLAGSVQGMIDASVRTRVENEIRQNAKKYDMLLGRTRR